MVSAHSSPLLSSTGGAFCRPGSHLLGAQTAEHQIPIWRSGPSSLLCSVNVLPCATCVYPNGRPVDLRWLCRTTLAFRPPPRPRIWRLVESCSIFGPGSAPHPRQRGVMGDPLGHMVGA